MSVVMNLVFPELLYLNEYGGNFDNYFNAVYAVFENHFIKSKNYFHGIIVTAPKYPLEENIHRTFYHITHEGEEEKDRTPDLRRMERIKFPKFIIKGSPHEELLVWKNKRRGQNRILIFNEAEGYLLVLTDRKKYLLLCTAYVIDTNHRKTKLIKEYEAYKNAKTA